MFGIGKSSIKSSCFQSYCYMTFLFTPYRFEANIHIHVLHYGWLLLIYLATHTNKGISKKKIYIYIILIHKTHLLNIFSSIVSTKRLRYFGYEYCLSCNIHGRRSQGRKWTVKRKTYVHISVANVGHRGMPPPPPRLIGELKRGRRGLVYATTHQLPLIMTFNVQKMSF